MTNPKIDNSIENTKVILWQYDNAPNLIGLIRKWNEFGKISVSDFWDYYRDKVVNIDEADEYGLNVWGNALNIPWPSVKIPTTSGQPDVHRIDIELYRRLLKAKMFLMWKPSTVENLNTYLSFLFPGSEEGKFGPGYVQMYKPRCRVLDNQDMSMSYTFPTEATGDEAYLYFQHYDLIFPFPVGIRYAGGFWNADRVLGFQGQGLKNMAYHDNVMVWADETVDGEDGGIFAGTDKANYKLTPKVKGKAFVIDVQISTEPDKVPSVNAQPTISGLTIGKRYWIDFGDGECGYVETTAASESETTVSYTKLNGYKEAGRYAICVYSEDGNVSANVAGATSYSL